MLHPLPVIPGIPQSVYQKTPVPMSLEEGRRTLSEYMLEIEILSVELEIAKVQPDRPENYDEWRLTRLQSRLLRLRQVKILRAWLRLQDSEYERQEVAEIRRFFALFLAPVVALLLSNNPVEKVQARNALGRRFRTLTGQD